LTTAKYGQLQPSTIISIIIIADDEITIASDEIYTKYRKQ
jgi:hypothetical protein